MSYYTKTGNPANNTRGLSTQVRAEFAAIESGFTQAETAINLKAPTASPAFTGVPTAPTAAADTSTTQIATTAFVQQELIGAVIGGIPGVGLSNVDIFTSNRTFTPAAGVTKYFVIAIGGGGSGVAAGSYPSGYGGNTVYGLMTISTPQLVTIGAGGIAPSAYGSDTSIGSLLVAKGGPYAYYSGPQEADTVPSGCVSILGGTSSQNEGRGSTFLIPSSIVANVAATQSSVWTCGAGGVSSATAGTWRNGGAGIVILMW